MKRTILAFIAGTLLTFSVTAYAAITSFSDVSTSDWFYNDVMNMAEWGVIQGHPDGTFHPADKVNRAELSAMWNRYEDHINQRLPENVYMDIELSSLYQELAWMSFDMSEQYRINNFTYNELLGTGASSSCSRIESLKENARGHLERAKNLTPTAITQSDIDWMMGEFDADYENCLTWVKY